MSPRVFICYRRDDSRWAAAMIHRALAAHFGADEVFLDHAGIDPGENFEDSIAEALGSCEVLLAIIGRQWTAMTDANGRRCLDRPDDFVVREIGAALARSCTVIPILVDGAPMPRVDELPANVAALQQRHAFAISEQRFDRDVALLIETIEGSAGDPLQGAIRTHLAAIKLRLDERRTAHPRDLQRNVLDFYIEAHGSTEPPGTSGATSAPLRELLMSSIEAGRPSIVLADFGMGKTWFLEHVQYELASSGNGRIPVWVSLRAFRPKAAPLSTWLFADWPRSIFDELRDQAWLAAFGEAVVIQSRDALMRRYADGRFVFLFDALDEMVLLNRRDRDAVLVELGALRQHARRSPIVLSCRRSFFTEASQEKRLAELGFDVYYLWPWERNDVALYLDKARAAGIVHSHGEAVRMAMHDIYDVRDLSTRALFSAMLASQWDDLTLADKLDIPSLYERHVEKAALEWQGPRSWQLEPHQLQRYMEELAFLMFRLDTLSVTAAELDEYFAEQFSTSKIDRFSTVAESIVRDIRTNSLLLRDGDSYAFCHASIWEFFVARRLARALIDDEPGAFQIASRAAQYESVFENFLIPMLQAQNKLGLLANLFA